MRSARSTVLLYLPVGLHAGVLAIGENAFTLVVSARRFRHVRNGPASQIDDHYRRHSLGLVTGERHLRFVIEKILSFDAATRVFALEHRLLIGQPGRAARILD